MHQIYTKKQKNNFFKVTRFDLQILENVRKILDAQELIKKHKKDFDKIMTQIETFDEDVIPLAVKILDADELLSYKEAFDELRQNHTFYMILESEDRIVLTHFSEIMSCVQLKIPYEIISFSYNEMK